MLNPQLYAGKVILAPMVRIGTLPMRLLAKSLGAGIKVKQTDCIYALFCFRFGILARNR